MSWRQKFRLAAHVAEIRDMLKSGKSGNSIAAKFGVTKRSIYLIARGASYSEVPRTRKSLRGRRQPLKPFVCKCGKNYHKAQSKLGLCDTCMATHYRDRHRLKASLKHHRRRGNGGRFTVAEWNLVLWIFAGHCFYCWRVFADFEKDHYIPVLHGGRDDIDNLVPACMKCNRSKGAKMPDEFMKEVSA